MSSQTYNRVSSRHPKLISLFEAWRQPAIEIRKGFSDRVREWRRRVRRRNELITLSDADLRDIGWTRAEVEAESRKPFWRA